MDKPVAILIGGVVQAVVDAADSCCPYEPNDACGGCGACLLAQAVHAGYELRDATPEEVAELARARHY